MPACMPAARGDRFVLRDHVAARDDRGHRRAGRPPRAATKRADAAPRPSETASPCGAASESADRGRRPWPAARSTAAATRARRCPARPARRAGAARCRALSSARRSASATTPGWAMLTPGQLRRRPRRRAAARWRSAAHDGAVPPDRPSFATVTRRLAISMATDGGVGASHEVERHRLCSSFDERHLVDLAQRRHAIEHPVDRALRAGTSCLRHAPRVLISDVGRRSRIMSRMRSVRSMSSQIAVRPLNPVPPHSMQPPPS